MGGYSPRTKPYPIYERSESNPRTRSFTCAYIYIDGVRCRERAECWMDVNEKERAPVCKMHRGTVQGVRRKTPVIYAETIPVRQPVKVGCTRAEGRMIEKLEKRMKVLE